MKRPLQSRIVAIALVAIALLVPTGAAHARQPQPSPTDVTGRVILPASRVRSHPPAVVVWLTPVERDAIPPPPGRFKLVQKNRMFTPHILVIPAGSVVSFPNEDPYFHNVFSLFNGRRFDLGLYEAGGTREVRFPRDGVSYIFCNIHPEMSAVVIAVSTPFYDVADASQNFSFHFVPPGDYEAHVWIEGTPQPELDKLARRVNVSGGQANLLSIDASSAHPRAHEHLNMFGKPYPKDVRPPY